MVSIILITLATIGALTIASLICLFVLADQHDALTEGERRQLRHRTETHKQQSPIHNEVETHA
jgi:hypothetical protein